MVRIDSYNDIQLTVLLKEGDINAFNDLYWKYHKALYFNSFKLTKNAGASEDIVQEVFIKLWENRKTIETEKSLSGWLFVISYNRSVNWLKRKLQEIKAQENLLYVDYGQEPSDVNNQEVDILEKAMQQLSPQKRKVFELCKLHGKSYSEAATALNISRHTVKEYMSLALSSIKEYVKKHPEHRANMALLMMTACITSAG